MQDGDDYFCGDSGMHPDSNQTQLVIFIAEPPSVSPLFVTHIFLICPQKQALLPPTTVFVRPT